MTEHTKEPWPEPVGEEWGGWERGRSLSMGMLGFQDYRRARACVGACAGIETEVFEAKESEYQDLATLIDGLIAQRDEARQALKESDDMLQAVAAQCEAAEREVIDLRERVEWAEKQEPVGEWVAVHGSDDKQVGYIKWVDTYRAKPGDKLYTKEPK